MSSKYCCIWCGIRINKNKFNFCKQDAKLNKLKLVKGFNSPHYWVIEIPTRKSSQFLGKSISEMYTDLYNEVSKESKLSKWRKK